MTQVECMLPAGGALQLMSDDEEDEEEDAGVAGLENEVDSEEADPSAESSSDAGSDDDDGDEFGEHSAMSCNYLWHCQSIIGCIVHVCSLA